jgi:micrococcal nuclease
MLKHGKFKAALTVLAFALVLAPLFYLAQDHQAEGPVGYARGYDAGFSAGANVSSLTGSNVSVPASSNFSSSVGPSASPNISVPESSNVSDTANSTVGDAVGYGAFLNRTVAWVIDGDTFNTTLGEYIRLADVDTPERGHKNYSAATRFLLRLIGHGTVYLDVDSMFGTDKYGRLVCVVYVQWNSTHLLNVNLALLESGLAKVWDCENEFSPADWTLYIVGGDV